MKTGPLLVVGMVPMVMVDRDCAERHPRPSKNINSIKLLLRVLLYVTLLRFTVFALLHFMGPRLSSLTANLFACWHRTS